MNSSKFRFSLELQSVQSQISLPALIGDTSRSFYISLTDGGIPYVIEDGCLAKLSIKRPTGTHIEEFCAIKDKSIIIYDFTQNKNTCAVEGIHTCDVTLYNADGAQVATASFTMIVSEKVIRSDDINLKDEEVSAIDAMLAAEASRQEAEIGRVNAEAARQTAESARVLAEETRETSEEERSNRFDEFLEESREIINKNSIPEVTEKDNGAFLCVVNGKWGKKAIDAAEEVSI